MTYPTTTHPSYLPDQPQRRPDMAAIERDLHTRHLVAVHGPPGRQADIADATHCGLEHGGMTKLQLTDLSWRTTSRVEDGPDGRAVEVTTTTLTNHPDVTTTCRTCLDDSHCVIGGITAPVPELGERRERATVRRGVATVDIAAGVVLDVIQLRTGMTLVRPRGEA